jgi:deazaflavin-dependent oxidoreductase (nitroreductase family)
MPSVSFLRLMNLVHRSVLGLSGGRVGSQMSGMPVLQLTTTGRTSGRPRTVILTAPAQVGDALVVVASRGGDDRQPDWFLNLERDPRVQVSVPNQPTRPMRARVASPQERDDLWPRIVADHTMYAGYQSKTDRLIPLVLLEPQA